MIPRNTGAPAPRWRRRFRILPKPEDVIIHPDGRITIQGETLEQLKLIARHEKISLEKCWQRLARKMKKSGWLERAAFEHMEKNPETIKNPAYFEELKRKFRKGAQ